MRNKKLIGALTVLALAGAACGPAAASHGSASNSSTSTAPPPSGSTGSTGNTGTASPPPAATPPPPPPTTTTAPPPQAQPATASFSCTGNAPEGVDITSGSDSSNLSGGNTVPWSASIPLDANAVYANVSAQLQGPDGAIACTTTVTWGGQTATKSGQASGNYNIASAEVCSDIISGGWNAC
jgi:hypothetical protein